MSHIETLIVNEVRKTLENLERSGVGFIDYENTGNFCYAVDNKRILVSVRTISEQMGE